MWGGVGWGGSPPAAAFPPAWLSLWTLHVDPGLLERGQQLPASSGASPAGLRGARSVILFLCPWFPPSAGTSAQVCSPPRYPGQRRTAGGGHSGMGLLDWLHSEDPTPPCPRPPLMSLLNPFPPQEPSRGPKAPLSRPKPRQVPKLDTTVQGNQSPGALHTPSRLSVLEPWLDPDWSGQCPADPHPCQSPCRPPPRLGPHLHLR